MQIELYGVLAEVAGAREIDLEVNGAGNVQGVLDVLQARVPALAEHLPRVACAVGDELITREEAVAADTTLVLLPPVSGG